MRALLMAGGLEVVEERAPKAEMAAFKDQLAAAGLPTISPPDQIEKVAAAAIRLPLTCHLLHLFTRHRLLRLCRRHRHRLRPAFLLRACLFLSPGFPCIAH